MTLTGGKPIGYQIPMLLGAHAGAVVTTIAVTSSGKTAGLSLAAPSYGHVVLGALAGAFCCVTSAAIYNKLCINPRESTNYQMLREDIPLIAAHPSTQVITQQPSEVSTPPLPETEFDPPPPYSEDRCLPPPYSDVAQAEDSCPPPPTYSEVIEQRGIATT